jgi:hypothetical protein
MKFSKCCLKLKRLLLDSWIRSTVRLVISGMCWTPISPVVKQLSNLILPSGTCPASWQRAFVTPIPKSSQPTALNDLRPKFVTPILSRLFERLIVRKFVLRAVPKTLIYDQFTVRPSGSTTAELTVVLHHVTRLLEDNLYVHCIFIDYVRAFDIQLIMRSSFVSYVFCYTF